MGTGVAVGTGVGVAVGFGVAVGTGVGVGDGAPPTAAATTAKSKLLIALSRYWSVLVEAGTVQLVSNAIMSPTLMLLSPFTSPVPVVGVPGVGVGAGVLIGVGVGVEVGTGVLLGIGVGGGVAPTATNLMAKSLLKFVTGSVIEPFIGSTTSVDES